MKALALRLPASLFAAVMGLAGLALAWRIAAEMFPVSPWIGELLGALSVVVFLILAAGYATKLIHAPEAIRAEFDNPAQGSFLSTITISLLLLGGVLRPWAFVLADLVWLAGATFHLLLAIALLSRWMGQPVDIRQVNPGWFIPTVGHIIAPITGAAFGHVELGWFFFAVGAFCTVVFYPIVVYRLLFHDKLLPALQPSLCILIVPPAVAFLAYLALGGAFDGFARSLFLAALFVALLVAARLRQLAAAPFGPSWWAYTFPLDALTVAALRYHEGLDAGFSGALAAILLTLTSLVVAAVFGLTLRALKEGSLLAPVQPILARKAA